MSQSLLGGDPGEMQQMATQFTQQSEAVRTTMTALDREAAKVGTAWTGPERSASKGPGRTTGRPSSAWRKSSRRPLG